MSPKTKRKKSRGITKKLKKVITYYYVFFGALIWHRL
jgi:hypothetical protein